MDATNPWILGAYGARRRALGWATLAVAGIWGAFVLHWTPFAPLGWLDSLGDPGRPWIFDLRNAVLAATLFGPLLVAALVATRVEGRRVLQAGSRPGRAALLGIGLGVAGFAFSIVVARLAGAVVPGTGPPLTLALAAPALANLLVVGFEAAVEEVYFRGWVQPVLCARWGAWVGLFATALFFAALHLFGALRAPIAMLNIFLAGLFFGLLAMRSGGLVLPITAHLAWNWTEGGLFGTDPNPGGDPTGVLFDLDLSGPSLWSGGADTMNGSLATTLVLILPVLMTAFAPGPARRAA